MTVEQLRADYASSLVYDNPYYRDIAVARVMSAMPKILDVLNVAIGWRESAGDDYGDELLCDAIDSFTGGAD